jgi:hypothetical protein
MSFKDLGEKNVQPRVETPEDAELRARAAARHAAKEAKHARSAEQRSAGKSPRGGAAKGEPRE